MFLNEFEYTTVKSMSKTLGKYQAMSLTVFQYTIVISMRKILGKHQAMFLKKYIIIAQFNKNIP